MRKFLPAAVLVIVLTACSGESIKTGIQLEPFYMRKSGHPDIEIFVEIADTPSERATGLMNRESLEEDQGMLFVFPEAQMMRFWMKNTLIPLDIIFFNAEGESIYVTTMEPCTQDPCPGYGPDAPAQWALELPAGFAAHHGITTGWMLGQ